MIILIIGHFLTFAEFLRIPRQYLNSAEKGKLRGSARNSAAHGKLWTLLITNRNSYTGSRLPSNLMTLDDLEC